MDLSARPNSFERTSACCPTLLPAPHLQSSSNCSLVFFSNQPRRADLTYQARSETLFGLLSHNYVVIRWRQSTCFTPDELLGISETLFFNMGNQTRISTGRYGWTGKVSAEVGMNMGMPEKRCGEAAQVTRAVGPPMVSIQLREAWI